MRDVFNRYSDYYDLLNSDKDYKSEVDYVLTLVGRHDTRPFKTILNLGCGTGRHDLILAENGYHVTGVDRSTTMLVIARETIAQHPDLPVVFIEEDIRALRHGKIFDLVLSLFHVVSYQTTQSDLEHVFNTAAAHLPTGGLFIFDFWYDEAVLHEKPEIREKFLENEATAVRRHATPTLHEETRTVEVNYRVEVRNKKDGLEEILYETHVMRYLSLIEIEEVLNKTGFDLMLAEEWLTGKRPGLSTWSVCCVGKKR